MHYLVISDGKKGHENQSIGLVEAITRRQEDTTYEVIPVTGKISNHTKPTAIISAGHQTHFRLLTLSRQLRSPSIVIMRPTLPCKLFTHCIIPEHDFFQRKSPPENVFLTLGALNKIPEKSPPKKNQAVILLGGPSKHFHWKLERILQAIIALVEKNPHFTWQIGDSRRTPPATLEAIQDLHLPIQAFHHNNTPPDWVSMTLLNSKTAWVTPDSTSMLFEALSAGCHLGTLPMKRHKTRLSRFQDELSARNWLTRFDDYKDLSGPLPSPPRKLNETGRCADFLISQLSANA